VDGVIACLGDMPEVNAALIDKLIDAFDPEKGALVVVPAIDGKRGNPAVWPRRFFSELAALQGDAGAQQLIRSVPEAVVEVPLSGTAALVDVDTPDALEAVKAKIEGA
jgi:molybdenum cofactor cytidylyltransferase